MGDLGLMQKIIIEKIVIKESPSFQEAHFSPNLHFNVFSGVSGAGKSVLMESILSLFGLKECKAKFLEATLKLEGLKPEFEGFLEEGEVILTLTKKDKIRYFLNAQNLPKKKITELFSPFIKHLGAKDDNALSQENLFFALDSFCTLKEARHSEILQNYRQSYTDFLQSQEQLKTLQEQALKIEELKEFVQFEIQKIQSLSPKKGEYEELLQIKKELSKKEKIAQSLGKVQEFLNHSHCVYEFLNLIGKDCKSVEVAFNELWEILETQNNLLETLDNLNPEEILNRLEALSALNHRYGGIDEALAYLESKKEELHSYENFENRLQEAQNYYQKAQENLHKQAKSLSQSRQNFLQEFTQTLNDALTQLKMPNALITLEEIPPNLLGTQNLKLLLAPNTPLKNLSSGEFNRMRLALLLTQKNTPHNALIILDEVDANLSGEESEGVALTLAQLSRDFQIFAISHQSHMPSLANEHFLIEKTPQGSQIKKLDKQGRIQEIARMISGKEITQEALDFAKLRLKDLQ